VDIVRGVSGFGLVLGLLLDYLHQPVDASGEPLVFGLLFEHLVPHYVLGFQSLDFLKRGFVDLVYICPGNDRRIHLKRHIIRQVHAIELSR
jgi:hypothetical protein